MRKKSSFQFLVFTFFFGALSLLEGHLPIPGQQRHPLLRPFQNPPALSKQNNPLLKGLKGLVQRHGVGFEPPQELIQVFQILGERHRFLSPPFRTRSRTPMRFLPFRIRRIPTSSIRPFRPTVNCISLFLLVREGQKTATKHRSPSKTFPELFVFQRKYDKILE